MDKKLPLYEMMIGDTIEGEEEVDFIALVEYPAIQKNFLAFSQQFVEPSQGESKEDFLPRCIEYVINEGKESEQAVAICSNIWEQNFAEIQVIVCKKCGHSWDYQEGGKDPYTCHMCGADNSKKESVGFNKFSIESTDQRIVTGALMVADLPIYRRDEDEEYYVSFSAAEIKKIVQRFFKKGYQSKVNVEHSTPVDGVYMFESFIIDREKGIMPPKGFEDISNGSWFGSFKVDNEKIWNEVKAGTFKGFSVEGLFRYEKTNKVITQEEEIMSQIFKILRQIEH
jgi:hypothetical protein